ncbi:hypothetical protein LTR08_000433 [Meristemomyces frigidus]|nr:hypothetical protein LTR08_000433 [Meristemomyces frigidus]
MDLTDVLLPVNDPLLDTPPSPSSSCSSSWESASDSDQDSYDRENSDDDTDAFLNLDPRFVDVGWGGECLREAEDIDFEFVYALHTFVATVEGQANATKGDTMVLLDDSNSYWWLVRVVKDSSIGYLPAEHIETPTERLARLNKHRNIDLSATMLSDNSEKTRNPLMKAMRRRNAKTVQFAAPTYVEASDYEYSTEEEEQAMIDPYGGAAAAEEAQHEEPDVAEVDEDDEDATASAPTNRGSFDREQLATIAPSIEEPQLSPKLVDKTEAAPLKSRKGTPRNTDSFLKDDSIETKKITITPGLLREDSISLKSVSSESTRNASVENLVKTTSPPDERAKKEGKDKKKEKQKGGIMGLFKSKKKDKKMKEDAGNESDMEKPSMEMARSESPRGTVQPTSGTNSPVERAATAVVTESRQMAQAKQAPPRPKLQSQPISQVSSPVRQPSNGQDTSKGFVAELAGDEPAHEMSTGREADIVEPPQQPGQIDTTSTPQQSLREKESPLSPIRNMLSSSGNMLASSTGILSSSNDKEPKPKKAKRSKQRVELDDFDSPTDEEGPNPFIREQEGGHQLRQLQSEETGGLGQERLSESPIEIMPGTFTPSIFPHGTFMHGTEIVHIPMPSPDEVADDKGEEGSLSSSPSLIERPAEVAEHSGSEADGEGGGEEEEDEEEEAEGVDGNDATPTAPRSPQPTTITAELSSSSKETPSSTPFSLRALSPDSTSTSTPSQRALTPRHATTPSLSLPSTPQPWSDASLRAWLDDGSEVRDLLALVHDRSAGITAVGQEHAMMAGLYVEQRVGVEKMMGELDGLLMGFLGRRGGRVG